MITGDEDREFLLQVGVFAAHLFAGMDFGKREVCIEFPGEIVKFRLSYHYSNQDYTLEHALKSRLFYEHTDLIEKFAQNLHDRWMSQMEVTEDARDRELQGG